MDVIPGIHAALIGLAALVPVVLVAVTGLDWWLERSRHSVGQALADWSGRHMWYALGLSLFYGFLLAHLFSQQ
jgi:hypothetical protein